MLYSCINIINWLCESEPSCCCYVALGARNVKSEDVLALALLYAFQIVCYKYHTFKKKKKKTQTAS